MKTESSIEILESRIAPASILTYIDLDGDKVKVTSSSATGDLNADGVATFDSTDVDLLQQLQKLTLGPDFKGTNLTFTVTKVAGGDGLANIGAIIATGVDLGKVSVQGDLGQIECGDEDATQPGLKTLKVRSLGRFGLATQAPGGDLQSNITGNLNSLIVLGDIVGAYVRVGNLADNAGLLSARVSGSVIGGAAANSGQIFAEGDLGPVTISRDVIGNAGAYSGSIGAGHKVASINVLGSVIGGAADDSGSLYAGYVASSDAGTFKIARDLIGGSGLRSGDIVINGGTTTSIKVGGSVIGGSGQRSGRIDAQDAGKIAVTGSVIGGSADDSGRIFAINVGTISIGQDVVGASISGSDSLSGSGGIAVSNVVKMTIGGSVIAGADNSIASLSADSITAFSIGTLSIKGSIVGNDANPVHIRINGKPALETGLALGRLTVSGHVEWAVIDTGSDTGNVKLGTVKVAGDWIASSLASGVTAGNVFYGDGDDVATGNFSSIAAIVIGGVIIGSGTTIDSFGFTAHEIGSFRVFGKTFPLTESQDPAVFFSLETLSDVKLRELG